MTQIAVSIQNVWKEFHIRRHFESSSSSLKEVLNSPIKKLINHSSPNENDRNEAFWALKDVSFDIKHGESVGLIGRNGAGKSTLLKILSRITRPSRGKVMLYEHVNSLLEIGTGFNADLSGRDNIFLNGSFLGMKQAEIRQKFDEIVAFSEIEQFIDTPVKYYSSGMYIRLAFSVAVHLTPELLLLDEVLSVGDAGFQQKSKNKMKELLSSGATIVLVSHNSPTVIDVCQRAVWLDHGELRMDGASTQVVRAYNQSLEASS